MQHLNEFSHIGFILCVTCSVGIAYPGSRNTGKHPIPTRIRIHNKHNQCNKHTPDPDPAQKETCTICFTCIVSLTRNAHPNTESLSKIPKLWGGRGDNRGGARCALAVCYTSQAYDVHNTIQTKPPNMFTQI